jgi:hypothetical protein
MTNYEIRKVIENHVFVNKLFNADQNSEVTSRLFLGHDDVLRGEISIPLANNRDGFIRQEIQLPFDPAITITGDRVTIKNIKLICDSNQTAIAVYGSHSKIENVWISGAEVGIEMATTSAYSPQIDTTLEHIKMTGILSKGITAYNGDSNTPTDRRLFDSLTIHDVSITLTGGVAADSGIELASDCKFSNANIVAQTWLINGDAEDSCGLRINGIVNQSFIKYTTERLGYDGNANGYGVTVGNSNSIGIGNDIYVYGQGSKLKDIKSGWTTGITTEWGNN